VVTSTPVTEVPALRTPRLLLVPLNSAHEAEHARASGNAADALRDTQAADVHWREHAFGPWAIRDGADNAFLGGAEVHFAGPGITGIEPDEVEVGWWVTEARRGEGIATEAMRVAVDDLWRRTRVERAVAYIAGENEPSHRLAARLGFAVRGPGRGRSGEPMTVYAVRRPVA
jgi:RimJ/RimL family protein N-acetyltransferase